MVDSKVFRKKMVRIFSNLALKIISILSLKCMAHWPSQVGKGEVTNQKRNSFYFWKNSIFFSDLLPHPYRPAWAIHLRDRIKIFFKARFEKIQTIFFLNTLLATILSHKLT